VSCRRRVFDVGVVTGGGRDALCESVCGSGQQGQHQWQQWSGRHGVRTHVQVSRQRTGTVYRQIEVAAAVAKTSQLLSIYVGSSLLFIHTKPLAGLGSSP